MKETNLKMHPQNEKYDRNWMLNTARYMSESDVPEATQALCYRAAIWWKNVTHFMNPDDERLPKLWHFYYALVKEIAMAGCDDLYLDSIHEDSIVLRCADIAGLDHKFLPQNTTMHIKNGNISVKKGSGPYDSIYTVKKG